MGGSKKGEKRGAAGKKRRIHPHETPGEILKEASQPGYRQHRQTTERRLEVARLIHGDANLAIDMSPKEIMIENARYFQQAAKDWERFSRQQAMIIPATENSTEAVRHGERMAEFYRSQATDHAMKAAPYVHAKLAAVITKQDAGDAARSIVDDLLDDIDQRQREGGPQLIEHEPAKKVG